MIFAFSSSLRTDANLSFAHARCTHGRSSPATRKGMAGRSIQCEKTTGIALDFFSDVIHVERIS